MVSPCESPWYKHYDRTVILIPDNKTIEYRRQKYKKLRDQCNFVPNPEEFHAWNIAAGIGADSIADEVDNEILRQMLGEVP